MSWNRIFFYYWLQIKKYKWHFYAVFIVYGLGVLINHVINPLLYKNVIDIISTNISSVSLLPELLRALLWIAIAILSYNLFYRIGDFIIVYFQANVIREIYNSTLEKLLNHSYAFFSNNFSGGLVAKSKRFATSFEKIHDTVSINMLAVVVHLTGIFFVLFSKVPNIATVFLLWVVIYILITFLFIKVKTKYDLLKARADSRVTSSFADTITNILNVKIFSGAWSEKALFDDVTKDEYTKKLKAWRFSNIQLATQGFLMGILQIFVMYLMINLWVKGNLSTGTLVLIQTYLVGLFDRLWNLGRDMTRLFELLTDAKEMVDILDQQPEIQDISMPEKSKISLGKINFQNINFEYTKDLAVFKNFNLEINSGEKVGLVGHSGSGKSTLARMLLRFVDIVSGEILIDGQNIAKLKQDDLRSYISYVPQESILFHRSIKENIAYSKPDATEDEIISAAKGAHAHEFIENLPHGYDTMVGERGVKLSGGERQRVAIARAMLKEAPILVLDEATSSLDSISETYIQEAFDKLMKGKTTIVIAHRLSTIQKMDRIIVLDKGKIVEEGTHKALLAKKGFYAELWDHQTGGFLEE